MTTDLENPIPTAPASPNPAMRILVFAPMGRNAEVLCRSITASGLACTACNDVHAVIHQQGEGAGVLLLTEEALQPGAAGTLRAALQSQPPWSDLPVILLASGDRLTAGGTDTIAALRNAGNVTLLERPARSITLATALQSALRARARQYEVRDLLARERAARDEALRANRVKDDFLATVSHELRTPLSAILLWVRLARAGRVPPGQLPDALRAIEESAQSQSALIEDLLDASRMISGKLLVTPDDILVAPVVHAAVQVVLPSAVAKGVHLETAVGGSRVKECLVRADGARVRQILWNLLANAVKFTPPGGRVRISVDVEGDYARIEVADSGGGISPEFLPHIFERFRQADVGTARTHGGLGLGLAISKQLVEMHGGTISAATGGPMGGAVFTVRLPLSKDSGCGKEPRPLPPSSNC